MKSRKKRTKIKIIFISLFIAIFILWIAPTIILKIVENDNYDKVYEFSTTEKNIFDIIDLYNYMLSNEPRYEVNINSNNGILYDNLCQINIRLKNFSINNKYKIELYKDNEIFNVIENVQDENINTEIQLVEGNNDIKVNIYEDENLLGTYNETLYYIQPYDKQFLDELENDGTQTHYRDGSMEDFDKSYELLKNEGSKYVRVEFIWQSIYINGKYNFSKYDEYIGKIDTSKTKILGLINGFGSLAGSDKKINTDEEFNSFIEFVDQIIKKYPYITQFEILNEVNQTSSYKGAYLTEQESNWYVKILKILHERYMDKEFIVAGTSVPTDSYADEKGTLITSQKFYRNILNGGINEYTNSFAIHPYCNNQNNNSYLYEVMDLHKELFNDYGGFTKTYITEYGFTVYKGENNSEEIQANKLIQQSTILDTYNTMMKIQYNFWNIGNDKNVASNNYGVVNNDYTPKKSYYALKNYYENTNGAEYVGTVNLADGLEAHVYDKDGKAKIIAWSDNSDNTISISYKNFSVRDLYGNEIDNTEGTLEITTSPVYLDNISDSYFYEAISNTALSGYSEFEEKFSSEIELVPGLSSEIESLKSYMTSLNGATTESEEVAKQEMASHYNLGNMILDAYRNRDLNIEYVKISSMLDMLNDIGNSYEDLVTVSAVTREPYYNSTDELIDSAENVMEINSDLNIVYPSKILDFAKELDEKSEYINSLTEENDIKTGLIVSNSLHAYYLADWANEFAKIYRDEYIEANPVTISYSNTSEWTNEDVVATLNIGKDSKVTNNNGNNTYTFNKNGTFTFEYERRGQAYKLEAKATNIDKKAPTIKGVEDGKIYINSAKPIIEDENISSIFIRFNDTTIAYYEGIILQDEGTYNITAMDKAGNTSVMEFYVVDENPDGYIINNNYIQNVWQKTTVKEFKEEFRLNANYTIKRSGSELHENDYVATGDTIELSAGISYTIVVAGDINNDGKVTVYDLSKLRRYILKQEEFNEIQLLAADINVDNQDIGVKDYSRMRIEILGRY